MPETVLALGPCEHCGQTHPESVLLCPVAEKLLPLEGRLLDGKFRFTRQLGEGGMGAVWQCENVLVHKTVAIKLIHVQFSRDEGVLSRFRNEATAAGRIGSRYICDILDLGSSELGPYIVMEMLNGTDFAAYVQRNHPVSFGLTAMVIRQALLGLEAAHAAGIVHRDLKPENIFMHQPEAGQLRVKLMDFGISKFTEGSGAGKTGMGVIMGTPEFMSPEQSEGAAQADARTDIWAMGVILYWALSGRNPYLGQTTAQTLMNVVMRDAPDLSTAAPHVPAELAAVVHRCLQKNPDDRWPSASALREALAPFEASEGLPFVAAVGGGPTPAPYAAGSAYPASAPSEDAGTIPRIAAAPVGGGSTFSSELAGPELSAATLDGGGQWNVGEVEERPHSNMRGGGVGLYLGIGVAAVLVLGGGAWLATRAGDEASIESPDIEAKAGAQPDPTPDPGAALDGGKESGEAGKDGASASPDVEDGGAKADNAKTDDAKADAEEKGEGDPKKGSDSKSGGSKSGSSKSGSSKSGSSKSGGSKSGSSKSGGSKSGSSKSGGSKSGSSKSGGSKSGSSKSGGSKSGGRLTPSRPPRTLSSSKPPRTGKLPGS